MFGQTRAKARVGAAFKIDNVIARVEEIGGEGERVIALSEDIDLYAGGSMPFAALSRRDSDTEDETRYQTVFAKKSRRRRCTDRGLHFTEEILHEIPHTFVTLHVGTGTFRPVHAEDIREHTACILSGFSVSQRTPRPRSTRRSVLFAVGRPVRVCLSRLPRKWEAFGANRID